ncbi:MAG: oxidoreductase [Rhodoferax sp.]|nr:oxidoreductase [Rhodoferax sp.]
MITFGVVGADHRHIYHLIEGLLREGATCAGCLSTSSDMKVLEGVHSRFPQIPRVDSAAQLYEDPSVDLIVTAAVPCERAGIAIAAMRHGKDVLADKPGVTDFDQLQAVEAAVRATGRRFAVCFSERMIVPSVATALRLVGEGAIGQVVQTIGLGPHRLNAGIRPGWFFDKRTYGGILVDIASHQIDQFLMLTGSTDAEIAHAAVGHFGKSTPDDFQDFGEVALKSKTNQSRGYVRVDWFTADGLPTWGDGRLFITGTEGSIELRKYVDIEGRSGTDHLFLCDRQGTRHIDCQNEPIVFFRNLVHDVKHRTETAITHAQVFTVCRLALEANARAMKESST